MITTRSMVPWLSLCPLLAVARGWGEALVLAIGLLVCAVATSIALKISRRFVSASLLSPLTVLVAGTVVVLEQLALSAWWPDWNTTIAPWWALVAGLSVLVCCPAGNSDDNRSFTHSLELASALSAALLIVGIARDGFGRVFWIANTPAGVLALLALLLAGIQALRLSSFFERRGK